MVIQAPCTSDGDLSADTKTVEVEVHGDLPRYARGTAPTPAGAVLPCVRERTAYWMVSRVAGSMPYCGRERSQRAVVLERLERRGQRVAEVGGALGVVDAVDVLGQRVGDLVLVGVA